MLPVVAGLTLTAIVVPWVFRRRSSWTNLLSNLDLTSALSRGEWRRASSAIESVSADAPALLAIPAIELPASYDLRWRFARLGGTNSVALFFHTAQGTGTLEFDAWSRAGLSGVQAIDGEDLRQLGGMNFPLEIGKEHEFLLDVRPDRIKVSTEGRVLIEQVMTGRRLSVTTPWAWNREWAGVPLALGSWHSPTSFRELSLRTT